MARHLYAIHDWDPTWAQMVQAAGVTGWCVTTHALAEEGPYDFRPMANYGITPIARLNYGYSPTGTLPLPGYYADFARLCALFVQKSPGCSRWIIANEINMKIEHPQGVPISPVDYARCFKLCRDAIKAIQPNAEVIPAAIAPWNVESGPWMDYFDVMLSVIGAGGLDGIALHTYSRGNTPDAVRSVAKMDPPFAQFYSGFRAFQDFLSHVPTAMRRLPVYITETNQGDNAWVDANSGWVQAAYREIDAWNRMGATQKIHCLALYRWPNYDKWGIEHKHGVQADFRAAMAHGYEAPKVQPGGGDIFLPVTPKPEGGTPVTVNREWDSRLDGRGVKVVDAPSGTAWRVVRGQWFDESQAGGRHHIYVEALDEAGNVLAGVPFTVSWPGGSATEHSKTGRGFDAGNFPMSKSLNEFSVRIDDALPSDTVSGIGMGANGNAGIHTSTLVTFQRTQAGTVTPPPPQTGEGPSQPEPAPEQGGGMGVLDPRAVAAILDVESGGRGFGPDGSLLIRFETHIFRRELGNDALWARHFQHGSPIWTGQKFRRSESEPWQEVHTGNQASEWAAFNLARMLHDEAAYRSISMGAPQVMGFNAQRVGYPTARAMFDAFGKSLAHQLAGFFNYFLSDPALYRALLARDWRTIALKYNGPGQADHYAALLKAAYERG